MRKKRFKLGDFILIPINGEYRIKIKTLFFKQKIVI